jgi:uncharacterized damage-inducible protein DinB
MSGTHAGLAASVSAEFERYFRHLAARVERAARSIPPEQLWVKPYAYGNSIGHLILHLTGNLNHYIGAGIAGTEYTRDRPREFTETEHPEPEALLERFWAAIELVITTLGKMQDSTYQEPIESNPPITTTFGLFLVCAAHLNNHIGQMSYLVRALGRSTDEPPVW